jgi:hypothetical protein
VRRIGSNRFEDEKLWDLSKRRSHREHQAYHGYPHSLLALISSVETPFPLGWVIALLPLYRLVDGAVIYPLDVYIRHKLSK